MAIHVESLAGRPGARDVTLALNEAARRRLAQASMEAGSGAATSSERSREGLDPASTAILRGELVAMGPLESTSRAAN